MAAKPHSMLADLIHDEASRQAYASTLRNYTRGFLDDANGAICDEIIAPAVAKKGLKGRFANYVPPLMETLGLAEVEHNPRNNRMRAK